MMKLLDMVKHPEWITVDNLYALKDCLDNRRDWLEEREPESSGLVYDEWEMRFEDWNELCEFCDEIIEMIDSGQDYKEQIEYLADDILSFHYTYRGLSRLKV
ncbi:MAG: hypothetical protein Q4A54_11780 [Parabacteroides sp.]|nr:hypothetical protein [Parabacteroides sp.]